MRYILEDTTLRFRFNTRRFSTGAPHTLAGTPSLAIYPEDSDTQITTGITLTVDNDSKTGLNLVVVDLSASASYAADKAYQVVIEAGTVDSVSVVGEVVYEFFIVAAGGLEDAITRTMAGTAQTGDSFARLGAPAGASHAADIAAVKTDTAATLIDTNELQTDWTNGGRLDLLIDAILADTNELQTDWVNGGRLDLLVDAIKAKTDNLPTDPADASDVAAAIAALNDLSAAEVNAEVVDALATDTYAEITGVPGYSASVTTMIRRMYASLINPLALSASKKTFKSAAGVAQWEKDLADDGTDYTESAGNAP